MKKHYEEFFSNHKDLTLKYFPKSDSSISDRTKKISWFQQLFTTKKIRNLKLYNISSLLVYSLFLSHLFFFNLKKFHEYEVVTLNRELSSGPTKQLPRITICPYYQLEDSIYYVRGSWFRIGLTGILFFENLLFYLLNRSGSLAMVGIN